MTRLPIPEFIESTQEKIRRLKIEENLLQRRKHWSAIKIQKYIRGWLTRNHLKMLNAKAVLIQKHWRGYQGRLIAAELVEKRYKKMVDDYYDKMAAKIQALWRGYWTRKTFNYYKYKLWLKLVLEANDNATKRIQEFRKAEEERMIQALDKEYEPWIHFMANKLHHMLRTIVRPGIYSDPKSVEYTEIEKFLARYQYKGFMTDLRRERFKEAVRKLLTKRVVEEPCMRGITNKRCVTTLKAQHTISNPCLNSTRK